MTALALIALALALALWTMATPHVAAGLALTGPSVAMRIGARSPRGSVAVGSAAPEADGDAPMSSPAYASSLASSYAVRILPPVENVSDGGMVGGGQFEWALHPLSSWEKPHRGEGTAALRAMDDCARLDGWADDATRSIRCRWSPEPSRHDTQTWSIDVAANEGDGAVDSELLCILCRVMVQSASSRIADGMRKTGVEEDALLRVTLPLTDGVGCQKVLLSELFTPDESDKHAGVRHLFTPLNAEYATMEIVDMVDQHGNVLGSLPRPYVHTWNILHRGIGMIVSKDVDIIEALSSGNTPEVEVYVHRRTATKRIFPSLYDMFVGGVSSSGEESRWTAAREVSEELGLERGLNTLEGKVEDGKQIQNPLSEELFRCSVCTSYNRCVVSMFAYACDPSAETISWQEEEVAWGEYVPYDIVRSAGKMSIDRLRAVGAWPGGIDGNSGLAVDAVGEELGYSSNKPKSKYSGEEPWETWDFVPDGLLVWEAWESFVMQKIKL